MDALSRAINEPETLRVITATTTEAVREACRRQNARGLAATILGRALTSGTLLATLGKDGHERVRVQIAGGGPIGAIMIDAHGDGRVRACTSKPLEPGHILNRMLEVEPRPSTGPAVGTRGHVVVTRDLGLATLDSESGSRGREARPPGHERSRSSSMARARAWARSYQGSVDLRSGEIDEDIEAYLDRSEQLPSVLRAAVILDANGLVLRSAGVLVQGFPGCDPASLEPIRARLGGLRAVLAGHERSQDELVGLALGGEGFRTMLQHPVSFHCPCGPERALEVLSSLGAADLDALASEQEQTEVRCNFCGDATTVDAAAIRDLAQRLRARQS